MPYAPRRGQTPRSHGLLRGQTPLSNASPHGRILPRQRRPAFLLLFLPLAIGDLHPRDPPRRTIAACDDTALRRRLHVLRNNHRHRMNAPPLVPPLLQKILVPLHHHPILRGRMSSGARCVRHVKRQFLLPVGYGGGDVPLLGRRRSTIAVVVVVVIVIVAVVIVVGIGIPSADGKDRLLTLVGLDLGVGRNAVDDFEAVVPSVDFGDAALYDVDGGARIAAIDVFIVVRVVGAGRRRRRRR
mmetsp:Transcript_24051/g.36559  ORF Transcript_24051/g.36559 Transcript_24051/m.36559 type:complete len:242 (+) Transcript_24051:71-796(+)